MQNFMEILKYNEYYLASKRKCFLDLVKMTISILGCFQKLRQSDIMGLPDGTVGKATTCDTCIPYGYELESQLFHF